MHYDIIFYKLTRAEKFAIVSGKAYSWGLKIGDGSHIYLRASSASLYSTGHTK